VDADELNETATVMQRVDGEGDTSSLWLGDARIIAGELVFENFTLVEAERGTGRISTVESCK
jgi:hypothetical protein